MEEYRGILQQQQNTHADTLRKKHGLICKLLPFGNDSVLYIAKPDWTNRFDEQRESTVGIFCAIWISEDLVANNQFAYNIHSKKLRALPGYNLTSVKFAREFRESVATTVAEWPNVNLDFGPLTLLEGRGDSSLDKFGECVSARIRGFVDVSAEIDRLLEAGKR